LAQKQAPFCGASLMFELAATPVLTGFCVGDEFHGVSARVKSATVLADMILCRENSLTDFRTPGARRLDIWAKL